MPPRLKCFRPRLLDIDPTKWSFAGKDEWLKRLADRIQGLQVKDHWIGKGNTAGAAVLSLFEVCKAIKIYISPFDAEDLATPGAGGKGEEDDRVEIYRPLLKSKDLG